MDDAGAAREPDREDQPVGVGLVHHDRAPEVEVPAVGQQQVEAVDVGQSVVVHQPDQSRAALDRQPQAGVEATGATDVPVEGPRDDRLGAEPLPRAVRGRIVDHHDLVEPVHLTEPAHESA